MTIRQKLLKILYPLIMRVLPKKNILINQQKKLTNVSFYHLEAILNNGTKLPFVTLQGKKVLLVNTASNCGYTNQFNDLEKLYRRYQEKLVILGFPANDFKQQEQLNDAAIAQFCQVNFGVSFPLMKKSAVVKSEQQNKVFEWLCHAEQNGWNDQQPEWNFSKYLVDEKGILTHYFGPGISPLSNEILKAVTD